MLGGVGGVFFFLFFSVCVCMMSDPTIKDLFGNLKERLFFIYIILLFSLKYFFFKKKHSSFISFSFLVFLLMVWDEVDMQFVLKEQITHALTPDVNSSKKKKERKHKLESGLLFSFCLLSGGLVWRVKCFPSCMV